MVFLPLVSEINLTRCTAVDMGEALEQANKQSSKQRQNVGLQLTSVLFL
jgi:hypothetical protein